MDAGKNRHGRKDEQGCGRVIGARFGDRARWLAVLAALVTAAATAVSAQASTGGASSFYGDTATAATNLAFSPMRIAGATWYGPGFYGNQTACGQVLRPNTIGVAHRSLPCGTTVKFAYRGHYLVTQVIDRGPYTRGNSWDLTNGARMALGFEGAGRIRYAIALASARR